MDGNNEDEHFEVEEEEINHQNQNQNLIYASLSDTKPNVALKLSGWDFYNKVLKGAKMITAPMVDHSFLSFRMLCRYYNSDLAYTPMFHSKLFATNEKYRKAFFSTCPQDRPLIVQFCSNQPEMLLSAARYVEAHCDGVDINLGCPQRIAKRGNYGAFLADGDWEVIYKLVNILHLNLSVPVTCKIRVFPEEAKTIQYAKMLEAAGCQFLVVHGRTKEQKGHSPGLANWDIIRKLRNILSIPVAANGNIQSFEDVQRCMDATGAVGVMSAEGLLANPSLFSGPEKKEPWEVARKYLHFCDLYYTHPKYIRSHLMKMLKGKIDKYMDMKEKILTGKCLQDFHQAIDILEERHKNNFPPILEPSKEKPTSTLDEAEILGSVNIFQ